MFSYLMIVKSRSIINDQNYREPKTIYDMLPKKKNTLLVVISIRAICVA